MEAIEKMVELQEGGKVYTRTIGSGTPILLLHGGPGGTSDCFTIFEKYLDLNKYQIIYYNQLGSKLSDKVTDEKLFTLERYVDEVEQVRKALNLDKFILLGHSWGGMLVIEYSLKYENDGHLIAGIISNMNSSIEISVNYSNTLKQQLLSKEDFEFVMAQEEKQQYDSPRYNKLMQETLYANCFCRLSETPDFLKDPEALTPNVYNYFQGDNEFVVTGAMLGWDRTNDLKNIKTKTLVMGAKYDTMNPEQKAEMANLLPNGELYICPNGAHFCFWDDADNYFAALNHFLNNI